MSNPIRALAVFMAAALLTTGLSFSAASAPQAADLPCAIPDSASCLDLQADQICALYGDTSNQCLTARNAALKARVREVTSVMNDLFGIIGGLEEKVDRQAARIKRLKERLRNR